MFVEGDYEATAYFLQRAVDKYLKAYLLGHGWSLKKTHELSALLADADSVAPGLASHRNVCARLSGYYFAQRYPPIASAIASATDIQRDASDATALIADLFPAEIAGPSIAAEG